MSAPKVFGREMVPYEGGWKLRDPLVYAESRGKGWAVYFGKAMPMVNFREGKTLAAALEKFERDVRESVAILGPLVGWAPLEKP